MSRQQGLGALPWIALAAVWFLWGSTYIGIRVAVASIPPFVMAGSRYVLAGLLMTAVVSALHRGAWEQLRAPQWRSLLAMSFMLLLCGNGLLCYAETQIPAGIAALITATVPMWMVLVSALVTRTHVRPLAWIGVAMGFAGIVVLTGLRAGAIPLVPALLVLAGSLTWAIGSVYGRHHADLRVNPLIPALEMLTGGAMLVAAGVALGELHGFRIEQVTREAVYGWLWLLGPGALAGYTAFQYAVRHLPTHVVATYGYVNPVVAVALGAWLLREPITPNVALGGAIIVAAVAAILAAGTPRLRARDLAETA